MAVEETIESISAYLFKEPDAHVFAVLDGAAAAGLLDKLYGLSPNFCCLFRGELGPDMAEVAPYLVQLEPETEFTRWVIEQGWGNHWGIFATSDADFRRMRSHLRSLLIVYDETGRPLRFRYYDPRVLRLYLPTCNAAELATVFGPVASFAVEAANADTLLSLQAASGTVEQTRYLIRRA